jgi:hypothetical protein
MWSTNTSTAFARIARWAGRQNVSYRQEGLRNRRLRLSRSGSEAPVPRLLLTPLVETATIAGWSVAGQSMECGGECTRVAEADI